MKILNRKLMFLILIMVYLISPDNYFLIYGIPKKSAIFAKKTPNPSHFWPNILDIKILNRKLMFMIPITTVLVSPDYLVTIYQNSKNQSFFAKNTVFRCLYQPSEKFLPSKFIFLTFTIVLGTYLTQISDAESFYF